MVKRSKVYKTLDKRNLTPEQYWALYYANPSAWVEEQTTYLYDDLKKTSKRLHRWQIFLLNGTYSNKLTVVLKCRQCLRFDQLIDTPKGMIPISKLKIGDNVYCIRNFGGSTIFNDPVIESHVEDVWCTGEKHVYKLTTNEGKEVIATLNHKFNNIQRYQRLCDFHENDNLTVIDYKYPLKYGTMFDSVKKIEYVGKYLTYDIAVYKHNNYFVNGINCHNSGISTAIASLMAHDILFSIIKGLIFVSASKVHAEELMDKFYKCMESIIDPRYKPTFIRKTRTEAEFSNGAKVWSLSSNHESMVGFTGCVVWDEAGRFEKRKSEDIWNSLYPTITTDGTRMYVISTPFGRENIFHRLCTNSVDEIQKDLGQDGSIIKIPKRIVKVPYIDVPHVRKNIALLKAECPSENIWKMQYELEFGEDDTDALFTYDFLRENAYDPDIEIIPFDLEELIRTDMNGNFIHIGDIL